MPKNIRLPSSKWLLLLVLAAGGIAYLSGNGAEGNKDEKGKPVEFVQPKRGTIEDVVTAQGKLEPKEYVDVGAQVSGQLKKVHVEIGDVVKNGQLLAEIDPEVYESRVQADKASLRTLEAQLAEQEAQITFARRQNERNKKLITSKAISQEALEDSDTTLKVAEAKAISLKAQIEQAQGVLDGNLANLSYTKIYAPIDGTIVSQTSREGQTLNASQSAPVLVQVANLDTMTVRAQVAEADVMRLKPGISVFFTTLGSQTRKWKGTVRQILPSPEVVNDVVLYNVLIDVDNKDRQLMTGMSTQIFFQLGKADNALLVPVEAISPKQGKKGDKKNAATNIYEVRVKDGGDTITKEVTIGLMTRDEAQVLSGLDESDEVAVKAKPEDPKAKRRFGPPPPI